MRTFVIFFLVNLISGAALTQIPEGVWVCSHKLRVGTWRDIQVDDERHLVFLRKTMDEDSIYSEGGEVLWIDSANTVRRLTDIRSDIEMGNYSNDGERLVFENDSFYFEVDSDSELTLIRGDWRGLRFESHYHRLPKSELSRNYARNLFLESDKSLILTVEDTVKRSFQLDLVSDRKVIISRMEADTPYSAHGTWHNRWVGNTLLFSFFDHFFGDMQLFYFHKDSSETMIGRTYSDAKALQEEPPELRVAFSTLDKTVDTEAIRTNLIGRWEATNEPLYYDSAIEFGYLSFQSFEITLDAEGNYAMMKSGTVLKHGDSIPLEEITEGRWEVGPRGTYLILEPKGESPICIYIAELSSEKMEAFSFIRALSEYDNFNAFENRKLELRRVGL